LEVLHKSYGVLIKIKNSGLHLLLPILEFIVLIVFFNKTFIFIYKRASPTFVKKHVSQTREKVGRIGFFESNKGNLLLL
jgi:hypothetical protein